VAPSFRRFQRVLLSTRHFAERAALNVMMTLFLFSTLAIGIMPAYLIAKPQATDRQERSDSNGNYFRQSSRDLQGRVTITALTKPNFFG
jgi:hypothetical protein